MACFSQFYFEHQVLRRTFFVRPFSIACYFLVVIFLLGVLLLLLSGSLEEKSRFFRCFTIDFFSFSLRPFVGEKSKNVLRMLSWMTWKATAKYVCERDWRRLMGGGRYKRDHKVCWEIILLWQRASSEFGIGWALKIFRHVRLILNDRGFSEVVLCRVCCWSLGAVC